MKKIIILLTGNERKKKSFQKCIANFNIDIKIMNPWIPEIQARDSGEVAKFSAKHGANLLKKPVVKMDSGFYIEGIKGFPGPLVQYVDSQIGADLFFEILKKLDNKNAYIKNSLAYCEPGGEAKLFESSCNGIVVPGPTQDEGTFIDRLFIPNHPKNKGQKTMGEIRKTNYDDFLEIWGDAEIQFANWLTKKQ